MKAKMKPVQLTIESAVLAGLLALGVLAGCEKKEPAKPTVPKPPAPDVTPKATSAAAASASNSAAAGTTGGASITSTTPTTRPTAQVSAGSATTKPSAPTIDAPLVTSSESAKRSKEAQTLIEKAMQALKDNRFDDCKAALDKVDAMGKDVAPETRELVTTTREALKKAQKLQTAPDLQTGEGPNK